VLTLEAPPAAVTVMADADRIKTIISNLLENAIKYSPSGGRIQCIVSMADRVATLRVVDSGVGIAREDLPRLFNRFERIENRETSHVGGTGLGLYLSRELARQHGGEIQAESHPHSGSTFTLTLPLSVAAAQLTEPVQSEPQPVAPRLHVVSADADADSESRLG
jgi:two-component system phosphate regulon sensor histidine kinase PhoR